MKLTWNLFIFLLLFALLAMQTSWAQRSKRGRDYERSRQKSSRPTSPSRAYQAGDKEDPHGIEDADAAADRLTKRRRRNWNKHPGFFHYGVAFELNFTTAGTDVTGAASGANGMGLGGMIVLDYDFSRGWLFGFRFMAGYKRMFVTSDETMDGFNAFPISIAVQKLKRVSRVATFRYGLGTSFEILDTATDTQTDNALFFTLDFDFPYVMAGTRFYIYKFKSGVNFLSGEALVGVRF